MADKNDNDDLMSEFAEFLKAKQESEKEQRDSEDFDIEIWDETGKGVRTKRSHAKPFLQKFGIDIDELTGDDDGDKGDGDKPKPKAKPTGRSSSTSGDVARKYFAKKVSK